MVEQSPTPMVSFTVPGEPVGKSRPRFIRATGRTYTPEKTVNYETLVRYEYHRQTDGYRFPEDSELGMRVEAFFEIPKSKPKRVKHDMEIGVVRHTSKPDADNVLKAVADALNHIAYKDDSAVVYVEVSKKYAPTPLTRVTIWRL